MIDSDIKELRTYVRIRVGHIDSGFKHINQFYFILTIRKTGDNYRAKNCVIIFVLQTLKLLAGLKENFITVVLINK